MTLELFSIYFVIRRLLYFVIRRLLTTYLLEHLPNEETLAKNEVLEAYLPWDKNIKRACK